MHLGYFVIVCCHVSSRGWVDAKRDQRPSKLYFVEQMGKMPKTSSTDHGIQHRKSLAVFLGCCGWLCRDAAVHFNWSLTAVIYLSFVGWFVRFLAVHSRTHARVRHDGLTNSARECWEWIRLHHTSTLYYHMCEWCINDNIENLNYTCSNIQLSYSPHTVCILRYFQ